MLKLLWTSIFIVNIIIIINNDNNLLDRSINNDNVKNLLDKYINNDKNLLDRSISNDNVKNLLDLNNNGPLEIFFTNYKYT